MTRSPRSPNVPTLIELGYNFSAVVPYGFVGPAGLSPDVIAKLETALTKGMETLSGKPHCRKST